MEGKVLAWIAAIVFIAIAIMAGLIEMARNDDPVPAPLAPSLQAPASSLREDQRRCQLLGEAAAVDADCLRIWAESRDRFLGRNPVANEGP